jgi:putative endonuclease
VDKQFFVYIMASGKHGTLYIGMTSNVLQRAWQHREGVIEGFTKRYGVEKLVHFETFEDAMHAKQR